MSPSLFQVTHLKRQSNVELDHFFPQGITFQAKKCRKTKLIAALIGLLSAAGLMTALYVTGTFSKAPLLPDRMEGEAEIVSVEGNEESYKLHIDYKRELLQLNYLGSHHKNRRQRRYITSNIVQLNISKIVVEDFKNKQRYFIVPSNGNTTTKCLKSKLKGEMIPRDILKRLRSGQVPDEIKNKYLKKYSFTDGTKVDVTTSEKNEAAINKVSIHAFNSSMTLASNSSNRFEFYNVSLLECFNYDESTGKVDEKFGESTQITYSPNDINSRIGNWTQDLEYVLDKLKTNHKSHGNKTAEPKRRRRRGFDWTYGAWCGPSNGGYENKCGETGKCKAPYDKVSEECKSCAPPFDDLDKDCMEHDRCLKEAGKGPKNCLPQGNRCACDFALGWKAYSRVRDCLFNGKHLCAFSAEQIGYVFTRMLSCWFPTNICFPTITTVCRCSKCSCPILKSSMACMNLKFCVPFGSGKVYW